MENRGCSYSDCCYYSWLWVHSLFLLSQFLPAYSQNQSCNANDLSSLVGFSNSLDSRVQGWSFNNSSPAATDCCSWPGVSCSGSRVVGLDLGNKSLKGSISDDIAKLDQLRSLNLSSNSLEGIVPSQLFHLQQLELLDVSVNLLSGSIPADVDLPSIRKFNISFNKFNGTLPVITGAANLVSFDVGFNEFSDRIDTGICNSSARVQILRFSKNFFSGNFPAGFGNCTSLTELAVDLNEISGNLPDDLFKLPSLSQLYLQQNRLSGPLSTAISNLSNLTHLDLSMNNFSARMPDIFSRFKKLEFFAAQSNYFTGPLPPSLSNLSSVRVLYLRNNSLSGGITLDFMAMNRLSSLDLGSNLFTGSIPTRLSYAAELRTLNLARNNLSGAIPKSFKNLTSLTYLSLSNNSITNISSSLKVLQKCPKLECLVLTKNFPGGGIVPVDGMQGFRNMQILVLANCGLSGSVPSWLVNSTKLQVLDLSWNRFAGTIPLWLGNFGSMFYLDLSNNSLTGEIPYNLTQMEGLISRNDSQQGSFIQDFPFFMKKNNSGTGLQYNQASSFPPSLSLSHNMLVGPILPAFGNLKKLHVLDLSNNQFSGTIPDQLSEMSSLETLDLSHNNLSGSIPASLNKLTFLSSFTVAYNNLIGSVPAGGQFSTFSSADFEGNPGLCGGVHLPSCSLKDDPQPISKKGKNDGVIIGMAVGIGLGTALLLAAVYIFVSRTHSRRPQYSVKEVVDDNGLLESMGHKLVLLFQNKDSKELSVGDILKATNNFDQANIIGCGGFGLVFKAMLPDGRKVAIKRLSGDYGQMEREFQAEVEALSRAQHRNLVLLQGYCRIGNDRLLIYSYMENGSLDYWLHENVEGESALDWSTRLQIAQGAARGLAYLHQSCQPHILHRDIKSSNILLNEKFEAHLADFGLARLILPYDTHVTTDLVGTLGYIPPEYGQASVASFKGDVYSFGVVLLELLTGRRPVDMCKPKGCRDLISWVLQMKEEKREEEVFDPLISDKRYSSQLFQVLEIACLCLNDSPKLRPTTQQLVAWLDNIGQDD